MNWKSFDDEAETALTPMQPVLFRIVEGDNYIVLSGHLNKLNKPVIYDIFARKFKNMPRRYEITHFNFEDRSPKL
jgi:hypothetical protein